jgi:hypothetical protein
MKIGTDISLRECMASGYLMMEFKKRELFPKHLKGKMDKDAYVNFEQTMGWITHTENGYPKVPGTPKRRLYSLYDCCYTFNDLLQIYIEYKDSIDSMCGMTEDDRNLDNPTEYDMLNLASDINAYCGLE